MSLMDYGRRIETVEREVQTLVRGLVTAPLDADVPTCPGWTTRDFVDHISEFTGFWTHVLCEGTGRPKPPFSELREGDDPAAHYESLGDALVEALRAATPETLMWTWMPSDQSAGFIARRCANELSVHRYDLQSVSGDRRPIPTDIAIDAVDEIFVMLTAWGAPPGGHVGRGESLELRATDSDSARTIVLAADGPILAEPEGDADLSLEGTASDICLVVFGRPPLGLVERRGDETVLERWYHEFTF
jgi:uncharacterized protein (TIGR03083 family)